MRSGIHRSERRSPVKVSYGGVLIDDEGRVLLREPKGHWGGYVWTFAKGGAEGGESPRAAALREVSEETGVDAEIVDELPGWYAGSTGDTKFFLMRPLRDHGRFRKDETASVRWVSFAEAAKLINETSLVKGRVRDLAVLSAAKAMYEQREES